jgi:hypothetical protein
MFTLSSMILRVVRRAKNVACSRSTTPHTCLTSSSSVSLASTYSKTILSPTDVPHKAPMSKPQGLDSENVPNERMMSSLSKGIALIFIYCTWKIPYKKIQRCTTVIFENRTMLKQKQDKTQFELKYTAGSSCRIKEQATRAATRTSVFSKRLYNKDFY